MDGGWWMVKTNLYWSNLFGHGKIKISMSEKKVFETYRGFVMAQETDSNEHMNVQFYTTKFDQATGQLLALIGYDPQEVKANNKGFAYLEMNIRYLKEVLEDDPIHIETTFLNCTEKVVTIQHEMKNSMSQQIASIAVAKWVVFDKVSRRAEKLSPEVRQKILSFTPE